MVHPRNFSVDLEGLTIIILIYLFPGPTDFVYCLGWGRRETGLSPRFWGGDMVIFSAMTKHSNFPDRGRGKTSPPLHWTEEYHTLNRFPSEPTVESIISESHIINNRTLLFIKPNRYWKYITAPRRRQIDSTSIAAPFQKVDTVATLRSNSRQSRYYVRVTSRISPPSPGDIIALPPYFWVPLKI